MHMDSSCNAQMDYRLLNAISTQCHLLRVRSVSFKQVALPTL